MSTDASATIFDDPPEPPAARRARILRLVEQATAGVPAARKPAAGALALTLDILRAWARETARMVVAGLLVRTLTPLLPDDDRPPDADLAAMAAFVLSEVARAGELYAGEVGEDVAAVVAAVFDDPTVRPVWDLYRHTAADPATGKALWRQHRPGLRLPGAEAFAARLVHHHTAQVDHLTRAFAGEMPHG